MPTDEREITNLKIGYVRDAIELVGSFAHLARKSFEAGDSKAAEHWQSEAEHFCLQAEQMLPGIPGIKTEFLLASLEKARKAINDLGKKKRSASA
jgi:hypothetical protein